MTDREAFLALVRLGVGCNSSDVIGQGDWPAIEALAAEQGLSAVVVDGIEQLPNNQRPPKEFLLGLIGVVLQEEQRYAIQVKASSDLALLFNKNYIRTYVLKGTVVAECYPKPFHRNSSDLDCYLLPNNSSFDAWALGNDLVKAQGYEVSTSFYKNSTFYLPGLVVENHKFMVPFRGNKRLKKLEIVLQSMMQEDKGEDRIDGSYLYRPPVMVSALFLVEHAYSHFLHEGLTWRHVLDWILFSKKHAKQIKWAVLDAFIDEFGFRRFYESYNRLGKYLVGEILREELTKADKKMLSDVWAPLDLHETTEGWRGKMYLAGNTWRARWKYRLFSDITWFQALWIQAKGVLFIKSPTLDCLK